jgi:hypothetical protein
MPDDFANQWNKSDGSNDEDIADGNYSVELVSAEGYETNSEKKIVKLWFKVLSGEHAGQTFGAPLFLTTAKAIDFHKHTTLALLGLDPARPIDNFGQFANAVSLLGGVRAEVGVTHWGESEPRILKVQVFSATAPPALGYKTETGRASSDRTAPSVPEALPVSGRDVDDDDIPF